MFTKADAAVMKALRDINRNAMNIKEHIINLRKSDFKDEASKTSSKPVDEMISSYKATIVGAISPLKINPRPFLNLYESILLSPYRTLGTPKGKHLKPKHQADIWNSKSITSGSKRRHLEAYNDIVETFMGTEAPSPEVVKSIIYKPVKDFHKEPPSAVVDHEVSTRTKGIDKETTDKVKDTVQKRPDTAHTIDDLFIAWHDYTKGHAKEMNIATKEEVAELRSQSLMINTCLIKFLSSKQIKLIDFKLEFGRASNNSILLADEISPDTCRFWDFHTNKKLDKDRFRDSLGGVFEAYQEIYDRILCIKYF